MTKKVRHEGRCGCGASGFRWFNIDYLCSKCMNEMIEKMKEMRKS